MGNSAWADFWPKAMAYWLSGPPQPVWYTGAMGGHHGHYPRGGVATAGAPVAPSPLSLHDGLKGGSRVAPGKVGKGGGSPCDEVMVRGWRRR
jgi:hypothetical protein